MSSLILTTREAAARLRVHPISLWKWRQRPDCGGLPFIRISTANIGYRESDIERFLDQRRIERLADEAAAETTRRRKRDGHAEASPAP